MSTIPASELVAVNPSVISAGGNALDVIGLLLTTSTQVPIGTVASFADALSVSDYFGASSAEASIAGFYFAGFDGSSRKPGSVLFAQYNDEDVAAYLRGGDVSALSLTELQAISGTLAVVVDGYSRGGSSITLSGAGSFSIAATTLQTDLNTTPATEAAFTAAISTTTMTVSAVSSGTLAVGQTVIGSGVTADTVITALGTGTGGTGTYTVSISQTVGSESMTTEPSPLVVTYDSVRGAFVITSGITGAPSTVAFATGTAAADLKLTSATGAVTSQGAAAAEPGSFMDGIVALTTDWVTFMTLFNPDASGNTNKQAFASWNSAQNNRYAYACWDTDITATTGVPATSSLGYILANNGDSGTSLNWADDATNGPELSAFVCGAAASIDFTERNGRITFAFKAQSGLTPSVTTATVANNLGGSPQAASRGNGYNFYGAYAQANNSFIWYQRGFVTGDFLWLDGYINQIWLNSSFQVALLVLMQNARSIPYNAAGNSLIQAALADPIAAGLNFGAYAPGTLSASQIAEVNAEAGANIAGTLQTQGYYLQVLQASSTVRAARGSPPCKFFYLDRGSVQAITLSSIAVQ